jgi:Uma2 family endonuclease
MQVYPTPVTPTPPAPRPTYADIEALPENLRGEIISGRLIVMPRPTLPHAQAASVLGALLLTTHQLGMGGPGGWYIVGEVELRLGIDPRFDTVVPDIAGWRLETVSPGLMRQKSATTCPDWVCEVLSPSTAARDRAEKLPFYARAGVGHVWLVDPAAQTLEVYERTSAGQWTVLGVWAGATVVHAAPFDTIGLDLTPLWVPTEPRESGAGAP